LRGPEIFIIEDHTQPTITIGLFFSGGKLFEKEANCGITELMLRAAPKGAVLPSGSSLSADFIAAQMEIWGGAIEPVVENDYFGYLLTLLSKNAEDGLKLLCDVLYHPKFEEDEVEKEKVALLAKIKALRDDNVFYPTTLFKKALFKNHPYGLPRYGLEAAVRNLKPEDLRAWHTARLVRAKPLLAIVGDTPGARRASFFAKLLPHAKFEPVKLPRAQERKLTAVIAEEEARDKRQTAMVIGFPLYDAGPEDWYALDVLQNLASGLGGRFFQELRDRQSLAYTVSLMVQENVLGGSLYGYIATAPENEAKALAGLKREFEKLKTQPISKEEFNEAVNKTIGSYQSALQNRRTLIERLIKNFLLGRGHEEIFDYGSKIKSITIEDVQAVAQRFINPECYAIGIVKCASV
jgi:zinc protease